MFSQPASGVFCCAAAAGAGTTGPGRPVLLRRNAFAKRSSPETFMAAPPSQAPTRRPARIYRNISPLDLSHYRMPVPAIVSILHRITGALLFFAMWLLLWLLQSSAHDVDTF